MRVSLGAGSKLLKDERVRVTFTTNGPPHDPRGEVVLIEYTIDLHRLKKSVLFPPVIFRLEVR